MLRFLSKLLSKSAAGAPPESSELKRPEGQSSQGSGRREPPTELDWSGVDYIPLPPSPPTCEVDGREEFHREYNHPELRPVFQAGFESQHTKVVRLATGLTAEQRQGGVGEVIAKAYRKLIVQRMKADQLMAAARQSIEMFEFVPDDVQEVDKRRFNRILDRMDKAGKTHRFTRVHATAPSSEPPFTITDNSGWALVDERKLTKSGQPDPAFDILAVNRSGTWLLDRSGKSVAGSTGKCVLRRTDRSGSVIAERSLAHDVYRIGSGASGSGIAIMDTLGVLYIYDMALNPVVETDLREDSRVVDHFHTVDTDYWGEFRSQVRAVDTAPGGDRYLFTIADEAWCCDATGRTVWGVVTPLKPGWERVVRRTGSFGASHEVEEALRLFGLSLPVNPADIKHKYRLLAFAHHPDRNPGDSAATERMKSVNKAFELLTGVDPTTLEFGESDKTYFARTEPDQVIEVAGMRLEITVTGDTPQDWVYAASFAAADGGVYIATYSGKVIHLSRAGSTLAVYDVGSCPSAIANSGRYTYFLTSTRLYVIEDRDKLAAFLDVFRRGRLIVSEGGFGLLSSKRFQWFSADGDMRGALTTRDPIRAIYAAEGGAIVQTRQHQVRVQGLDI